MIDRRLNYGRHHVRRFLRRATPFDSVIDLGAGKGNDLRTARDLCPDSSLHAVDFNERNLERLQADGMTPWRLDIEREPLPFGDAAVDVVIANQILEHVKEIFWVLHELSRVLHVGGHVIVGVPNLAAWHNRALLLLGRQPSPLRNASAHVRGWTKRDLVDVLETGFPGGYALRDFGGGNFYPFPPPLARPLAATLPNLAWGIFASFQKVGAYDGSFLRTVRQRGLETAFFTGA